MRRRRRGIYLADPRKQGLAPADPDGLMWNGTSRVSPKWLHNAIGDRLFHSIEPYYQFDPSYDWAKQTRRVKDERAAEK